LPTQFALCRRTSDL